MKWPRVRLMIGWAMLAAGLGGLLLVGMDHLRIRTLADSYRRKADSAAHLEWRCRQIDAMGPAEREQEAGAAYDFDWVLLTNPEVNGRMMSYWAELRDKYEHASAVPRAAVLPDPDPPWTAPPEPK